MIQMNDLQLSYGTQPVEPIVSQMNLHLQAGMTYALIGPNGSGKSTLLKTLAGIKTDYQGEILLEGLLQDNLTKDLKSLSSQELSEFMAWMPSRLESYVDWNVKEFICSSFQKKMSWSYDLSEDESQRLDQLSSALEIEHLYTKSIHLLSDGERQRVLLAKCLCLNKEILLLDEPISFVDLPHKFSIVHFFKNYVKEQNKLLIYSTHDLALSLEFCDRVIFIHDGLGELISPDEFYENESVKLWLGQSHSFLKNM